MDYAAIIGWATVRTKVLPQRMEALRAGVPSRLSRTEAGAA